MIWFLGLPKPMSKPNWNEASAKTIHGNLGTKLSSEISEPNPLKRSFRLNHPCQADKLQVAEVPADPCCSDAAGGSGNITG